MLLTPGTLVIQTGFLGDVVLTTPLLAALADQFGPVDVVTTPAAAPLVETHPAVRRVIRYDKRGGAWGWSGLRRLGAELRRSGYARAYLPHRSSRSAMLALLARIPERVGFAGGPAALTYTSRRPRPRVGHEADRLLALAGEPPGPGAPTVRLGLTPADHAEAAAWLSGHGVGAGFVAVAPGSIWGTKRWPYYPELVRRLAVPVVAIGGPEDAPLAAAVAAAAPGRAHAAAGALSLRASAALIARAAALVTNDSAPLHLATAVGTPVVAVFGPTVPEFGFGPRGDRDVTLGHGGLACRPCSAHGPRRCPLGHHRCMRELTIETVLGAVTGVEDRRAICPGH